MQRDACPQHENFGNERYKYSLTVGVGLQLRPIKLAAHITNSVQVPVAYYMLQDTGIFTSSNHVHCNSLVRSDRSNVEKTRATLKKTVTFLDFEKKTTKRTYRFRGHVITLVFNTQLPKVSTGKSPTSNILLCNNVSVITQPNFSFKSQLFGNIRSNGSHSKSWGLNYSVNSFRRIED